MGSAPSRRLRTLPDPPTQFNGTPNKLPLSAGTPLWRVHREKYPADEFNPNPVAQDLASEFAGGRFDSATQDPYPFLYAAADDRTAVAEKLLRDLPVSQFGKREMLSQEVSGLCVSQIDVAAGLELVSLRSGSDLAAIGIDTRLTIGPSTEYPVTREWSAAIREWADWAQGLTWRSGREPDGFAFVFFGDRIGTGDIVMSANSSCGAEAFDLITLILSQYNVAVRDES
ncbi:RES family NAD+ phosphorylase [Candidatus Poriferisodalis sp.]|uniref:RES family NAD+ phosphorylase n=1 Tax=Candidatus Poriferisodalis sp. TaxID=3101277 RepID=UPI003B017893